MKIRLIVSDRADEDWSAIQETIANGGGRSALNQYMSHLDRLLDAIIEAPEIYATRPRLGRGVRVGIIHPYLVIYRFFPRRGTVEVIRIVHGRRKITPRTLR